MITPWVYISLILFITGCRVPGPQRPQPISIGEQPPTFQTADLQNPAFTPSISSTINTKNQTITSQPEEIEHKATRTFIEGSTPAQKIVPQYELITCQQDGCIYESGQFFLIPIPEGHNRNVEPTYRYGSTQGGNREPHIGVEFDNPTGTAVIAAEDGIVFALGADSKEIWGPYPDFYGNFIVLEHALPGFAEPVFTLYGHLSDTKVEMGDAVKKGQIIGLVGKTGTAVGSHLHFEVRKSGMELSHTINPELWFENDFDQETRLPMGKLIVRIDFKDKTIYGVDVLIQNFDDPNAPFKPAIYAETYAYGIPRDDFWKENLVIGEIPPGTYRASFTRQGKSYQKYFEIEPNRITLVEFQVDY